MVDTLGSEEPRELAGAAEIEANEIEGDESSWEGAADVEQDPQYAEGLAHLQAGEWQQAIERFEALVEVYPESETLQNVLEDTRLRAEFDASKRVRARRVVIPWRRLIFTILTLAAVGAFGYGSVQVIRNQVAPVLAQARIERERAQLLTDANAFLEAGNLDAAEATYRKLLSQVPSHAEAAQGMGEIAEQRKLLALYEKGVTAQRLGHYELALTSFTDLSVRSPGYRDVRHRITQVQSQVRIESLMANAEDRYSEGAYLEALGIYEQVRAINANFQSELVTSRLFDLYLRLGIELIEQTPPAPEMLPKAIDYLGQALVIRPRSVEAATEQRLARLFVEGQSLHFEGYADQAINRLRPLYDQRPRYLGGILPGMLYEAYNRSGDMHRRNDDLQFAYEQYRKALEMPVADKTLALARLEEIVPFLTPTPTPTSTPTPTNTPLPTGTPRPTAVPTPRPLASYHNLIVFYADHPDEPGYWVMDATGANRQYIGKSRGLDREIEALIEEAKYSPDRRYKLTVADADRRAQVFVLLPEEERQPHYQMWQLTKHTGISYDPVWSPDGSKVAFVSQENQSDDIWIINADGSGRRNLTPSTWEWDKHPSWSPDGTRIVFWSNREGRMQLFIMDADGRNVRNISNTDWEEYNPIWVK